MGCSWGNGMNSQLSWDIVDHNVEPHLKGFPQWGKPTSKRLAQEETMKSHGFLLDSMLVPMIKSWNIHLLDWHWIGHCRAVYIVEIHQGKYMDSPRGIKHDSLVGWATYPSEKWWSSKVSWDDEIPKWMEKNMFQNHQSDFSITIGF